MRHVLIIKQRQSLSSSLSLSSSSSSSKKKKKKKKNKTTDIQEIKDIIVKPNEEPKPLFQVSDNTKGASPPVIVGNVDSRSALFGRLNRGMGLLAINQIPLMNAEYARQTLQNIGPLGYTLTVTVSEAERRGSLFNMMNALMLDNQLMTNKLDFPRLEGERTMQPPCSAMRLISESATSSGVYGGLRKKSKVRAGVLEITNYRVIFMENSTGQISEIPMGHIFKLETKASTFILPATFGGW